MDLNEGKTIDFIKKEKYINFFDLENENKIYAMEYLSNLDVFIHVKKNLFFYRKDMLYSKQETWR